MIVLIEILLIIILVLITVTLALDERNSRNRAKHLVRLKGFWDGSERRVVKRHNVNLDVNYSINHKFKNSKGKDISTHGIGLLLEEKLERRTPLSIEIKINGEKETIKAKGKVMWSREAVEDERYSQRRLFNTGIKFTKFSDLLQEKKLFNYIKSIEASSPQEYVGL